MRTPVEPGLTPDDPPPWRVRRVDRVHPLGLRLTVAAVAAFLVLVPFGLLAVLVAGDWGPLHRLDLGAANTFHNAVAGHPAVVRTMLIWSDVFDPNSLRAAALVLVIWLVRRRARRMAIWVTTTMAVGGLLGVVLKLLVGRHRPDLLDPVARAAGYSFPSGHALNAALAAAVFLLVFLPMTRRWRPLLWAVAIIVTVVTGLCRIALGVHFVSDVAGGWILGLAVVAATSAAFGTWRHHPSSSGTDQTSTASP